jgi:hypothetical protein
VRERKTYIAGQLYDESTRDEGWGDYPEIDAALSEAFGVNLSLHAALGYSLHRCRCASRFVAHYSAHRCFDCRAAVKRANLRRASIKRAEARAKARAETLRCRHCGTPSQTRRGPPRRSARVAAFRVRRHNRGPLVAEAAQDRGLITAKASLHGHHPKGTTTMETMMQTKEMNEMASEAHRHVGDAIGALEEAKYIFDLLVSMLARTADGQIYDADKNAAVADATSALKTAKQALSKVYGALGELATE